MEKQRRKKRPYIPPVPGTGTDDGFRRLTEDEIKALQRDSIESMALIRAYMEELDAADEKALREKQEREKQE